MTTANINAAKSEAPTVLASSLSRRFGDRIVLDQLDLSIAPGEFVALLGRSGSGKTTLLRHLAGLDPVESGSLSLPRTRAVVFQEPRLVPWKRVRRNVALGLRKADAGPRAIAALNEVELGHKADAWPATLSGGEAQRVALARALVREPALLLLDEPFAALDALTRMRMHGLVVDLWRRHRPAVLLVTHDVDEAIFLADRVLVLVDGKIATDEIVDLPRPHAHEQPGFIAARRRLLQALGVVAPTAHIVEAPRALAKAAAR